MPSSDYEKRPGENKWQFEKRVYGPRTDLMAIYRPQDTLPIFVNVEEMMRLAAATQTAVDKFGVTNYAMSSLPARIVKEGRPDAGANKYDTKNVNDVALYDALDNAGHKFLSPMYAAAIAGAERRARQNNTSIDRAYNGLGVNAHGQTGEQYAKDMQTLYIPGVEADPRSAPLRDLIVRAANHDLKPQEKDLLTPYDQDRIWWRSGRHFTEASQMVPENKKKLIDEATDKGFNLQFYIVHKDRKLRGSNTQNTVMMEDMEEKFPEAAAVGESIRQQLGKEIAAMDARNAKQPAAPAQDGGLLDTIRNFANSLLN